MCKGANEVRFLQVYDHGHLAATVGHQGLADKSFYLLTSGSRSSRFACAREEA